MSENHLPAKKRLRWRLPEFVGAVVEVWGFNAQSHTVASVSVKDEIVESNTVVKCAFDPEKTGSENVFASSPIFDPVSILSHRQDRDRNFGSSLPVDPCLLARTDGERSVPSDHKSESQWGVRTARPFPLVVPELRYASEAQEVTGVELDATDSCGQGAEVNSESQVNEESVGVTSAESEGTSMWTSNKVSTNNSKPIIWVSKAVTRHGRR